MTTNGNGKGALIANIVQGSVIVALVGIMLKLFLIVNTAAAANTVKLARVEEREENHYENLCGELKEIKTLLKELADD